MFRNAVLVALVLVRVPGVSLLFQRPFFHDAVLGVPVPFADLERALSAQDVVPGVGLRAHYPELGEAMLVCATETKTAADLDTYAEHLERILQRRKVLACPVGPKW